MPRTKKTPDNLYQRNGVWWLRYNADGKKIRRSLRTRLLKEAKKLRDEFLARRSARARLGLPMPEQAAPVRTFAEVAKMWLESRAADGRLAPNTLKQNHHYVRRILDPRFGPMLMNAITVEHIEHFIGALREKYSRASVASYFSCFRSIVRHAIRRDWFAGPNPLDRLDRVPSPGPGRDVTITEDEARALLAKLTGRIFVKCALALYTGLRWGEINGLAWADLDLDATPPTLTVCRSYRGKPKNEASAATVPISKEAVALMRSWKLEQGGDSPWVFPTQQGKIPAGRSQRELNLIHDATARAGIQKHITPHVFRHTFGTWVYERTNDPKMVQRLMRHSNFKTSMQYVHDRRSLAPVVDSLPDLTSRPALKAV